MDWMSNSVRNVELPEIIGYFYFYFYPRELYMMLLVLISSNLGFKDLLLST